MCKWVCLSRSTRSALAAGEGALLMQGERMGGFKALYFNTTLGPVWSLAFFDLESAEIKGRFAWILCTY